MHSHADLTYDICIQGMIEFDGTSHMWRFKPSADSEMSPRTVKIMAGIYATMIRMSSHFKPFNILCLVYKRMATTKVMIMKPTIPTILLAGPLVSGSVWFGGGQEAMTDFGGILIFRKQEPTPTGVSKENRCPLLGCLENLADLLW